MSCQSGLRYVARSCGRYSGSVIIDPSSTVYQRHRAMANSIIKKTTPASIGALAAENVYNGLDKTASGFALDARQGKELKDTMTMIGNGAFNLGNMDGSSSRVLTTTNSAHAILVLSGPNDNLFGLYIIRLGTTTPNIVTITQGSDITITPASGKITIRNNSNNQLAVNVIPLSRDSSYFVLT